MAKHLTPIVGLAVVVALALAAVFGSMSLANPAMAQDAVPDVEGLRVTHVSPNSVSLEWDFIDTYGVTDYRATWTKAGPGGNTLQGEEMQSTATDSDVFYISSAGSATTKVMAVVTPATETNLPFAVGDTYTIYVQARKGSNAGTYASVMATPLNAPDTGAITITSATVSDAKPGEVTLTWTRTNPAVDPDNLSNWQYRLVPGTVNQTAGADTPNNATDDTFGWAGDTPAPGPDDWMDFASVSVAVGPDNTADTADDVHTGTITGLENKEYRFEVRARNGAAFNATLTLTAFPAGTAAVLTDGTATTTAPPVAVMPAAAPPMPIMNLTVKPGVREVTLTWDAVADNVVSYQYRYRQAGGTYAKPNNDEGWMTVNRSADFDAAELETWQTGNVVIDGLMAGVMYTFQVRLVGDNGLMSERATDTATPMSPVVDCYGLPKFEQDSNNPGDSTSYTVTFCLGTTPDAMTRMPFNLGGHLVNTRERDLVIEFHEDYGVPSTISPISVAITTDVRDDRPGDETYTPEDVYVDGEKVRLSLGDLDERDQSSEYVFDGSERISVHFRQSAGITTPTEAGSYELVGIEFGSNSVEYNDGTKARLPNMKQPIYRKVSLSEEDGGLDTTVEAKGSGFKNGTSLTVFRDEAIIVEWDRDGNDDTDRVMVEATASDVKAYNDAVKAALAMEDGKFTDVGNVPYIYVDDEDMPLTTATMTVNNKVGTYATAPNGTQQSNEDTLCVARSIGGDDIGKCEFKVTHPTFTGGVNYVNARDGRSQHGRRADTFVLEASIIATPTTASPGERILVQVVDFPPNSSISEVQLARNTLRPVIFTGGAVDGAGAGTLSFIVPNWPSAGTQELKVFGADDVDASVNVTIGGPQIMVTPGTVLANQRISLIGTGFSPRKVIANADIESGDSMPIVTIGGKPISSDRINDGEPVRVDNGGNWSASVDLPLAEATTGEGERLIRVTDSGNRTGGVRVNIPGREVTITPDSGRVGTIAVIRGTGFPSKNDEGDSFNISVVYETSSGQTTVSASPDASGRFEVQLRIPTTAAIPSSNTVKVSFTDADGVIVPLTIPHEVPEGLITLSSTSGGPGSTITVNGEGFKSFVPIRLVKVGTLDVTPAPKPSTDGNGMMTFDILIPGLDVGIQTIEVSVGDTTASTGFTVTESGVNPGDIKPVAEAIEDLGDNLVSVWNFNNDTKVWAFYDPTLAEGNTLTHMITGETYLIRVKTDVEVILNRDTRSLTCVGGNCWNQVVW